MPLQSVLGPSDHLLRLTVWAEPNKFTSARKVGACGNPLDET